MTETNKAQIDELVSEVMDWHYGVCSIIFGAEDYAQDATELVDIITRHVDDRVKETLATIEQIDFFGWNDHTQRMIKDRIISSFIKNNK